MRLKPSRTTTAAVVILCNSLRIASMSFSDEPPERFLQRFHWQANDVAHGPLFHRQIGVARQLDRVRPAATFPLPRLQVILDLRIRKWLHAYGAPLLPGELPVAGPYPHADAGPKFVHRSGK